MSRRPSKPHVRVIFRDVAGREWEMFEHVIVAGIRHMRSVRDGDADYRTFVPFDGGAPKQYRFFRDSPNGGRSLYPGVLQRQLAAGRRAAAAEQSVLLIDTVFSASNPRGT